MFSCIGIVPCFFRGFLAPWSLQGFDLDELTKKQPVAFTKDEDFDVSKMPSSWPKIRFFFLNLVAPKCVEDMSSISGWWQLKYFYFHPGSLGK